MNDLVNDMVTEKFDKSENTKLDAAEVKKMLMEDYGLSEDQIDIQSLLIDTHGDGQVICISWGGDLRWSLVYGRLPTDSSLSADRG